MKRSLKYVLVVVFPVIGLGFLFGSCASTESCNNDACYQRKISSVDPYKAGEIAAWGSEKEVAEKEEEDERKLLRFKEYRTRESRNQ